MPTFDVDSAFQRDYDRLLPRQRQLFRAARLAFFDDLVAHPGRFRPSLRVKRVQAHEGVWELTFAPDGRATFSYGEAVHEGDVHIIWRRIGTHDIFERP